MVVVARTATVVGRQHHGRACRAGEIDINVASHRLRNGQTDSGEPVGSRQTAHAGHRLREEIVGSIVGDCPAVSMEILARSRAPKRQRKQQKQTASQHMGTKTITGVNDIFHTRIQFE
jgi:hypothetical protein